MFLNSKWQACKALGKRSMAFVRQKLSQLTTFWAGILHWICSRTLPQMMMTVLIVFLVIWSVSLAP